MVAGEIRDSNAGLVPPEDYEAILLRIHNNAELFKNGEAGILSWNTQKQDLIMEMAHDIAFLIDKKHAKYMGHERHDVSMLICDMLKEHHFVDESAYSWVRKTCAPHGYTNQKFANLERHENKQVPFVYYSKEQLHELFGKLPVDEQINFFNRILASDTERKRQIKLTKDNIRQIFEQQGINPKTYSNKANPFDPAYDETYSNADDIPTPPEELKQYHHSLDEIDDIINDIDRLKKIWLGIRGNFELFPPQNYELDIKIATMLKGTKEHVFEFLLRVYSGFNDNKAVATWPEWFNYLEHKAIHGNNAAASKFATSTGQFQEVTRPDGKKVIQLLKRKVTNEHLKKKMPEQVKEVKNFWLFKEMVGGLDEWYNNQYYIKGGSDIENAEIEQEYKTS